MFIWVFDARPQPGGSEARLRLFLAFLGYGLISSLGGGLLAIGATAAMVISPFLFLLFMILAFEATVAILLVAMVAVLPLAFLGTCAFDLHGTGGDLCPLPPASAAALRDWQRGWAQGWDSKALDAELIGPVLLVLLVAFMVAPMVCRLIQPLLAYSLRRSRESALSYWRQTCILLAVLPPIGVGMTVSMASSRDLPNWLIVASLAMTMTAIGSPLIWLWLRFGLARRIDPERGRQLGVVALLRERRNAARRADEEPGWWERPMIWLRDGLCALVLLALVIAVGAAIFRGFLFLPLLLFGIPLLLVVMVLAGNWFEFGAD